jgi:hypothetical protein
MHIDIALHFKPFSHEPGTICLIPGTSWRVQAFPTLIRLLGPNGENLEHRFSHQEIIEGFTIEQDLEKKEIRIFGKPKLDCRIAQGKIWENKQVVFEFPASTAIDKIERFSLGVHKAQEWEGIRRRLDLTEILPLWFHLGQMTPSKARQGKGTLLLLEECQKFRVAKDKLQLEKTLKHLFLSGFGRMFDPRVHDSEYRGIASNTEEDSEAALALLAEGAKLIRSLLFTQNGICWQILPCLLPHFHSGRFQCELFDLEWSNTKLKKMIIHPTYDQEVILEWPSDLHECRLRKDLKEKGRVLKRTEPLFLSKNQVIYLDCFERL